MTIDAFLHYLRNEALTGGTENKLAKPAKAEQIEFWEDANPKFVLPEPYKRLLLQANGLRLHASSDTPLGLLHIMPINRIKPLAEQVMEISGLTEEDLTDPPTCLMVGEDQDSQWCLGIDTETGHFLQVDYTGETTDLGKMEAFLDWLVDWLNAKEQS